jgi:uncharacterized protein YqjF (DUF2071 family)
MLNQKNEIVAPVFLTAEWRYLAMLNYEIEPALLKPHVPAGTELDFWNGKTFVSVVGFLFLNTRVLGFPVPFHRNFEEVNLRFYVRRKAGGRHRGVVFIKELVPRFMIALVARTLYNERYSALKMSHDVQKEAANENVKAVIYKWRYRGTENSLEVVTEGKPSFVAENSEEEFITEHYWGYAAQRDGSTLEYKVEHPRWRVWQTSRAIVTADVAALYGEKFASCLAQRPSSAFLAEGSSVKVRRGVRLMKTVDEDRLTLFTS